MGETTPIPLPRRILVAVLQQVSGLIYHQFAWAYDLVAWMVSLGAWKHWVQAALPFIEGPHVLEIGFGPGHLLLELQAKRIKVFGLDESSHMVRIARKRLSRVAAYPNLVRGRAETLPFASRSMHQVVLTFPAEFVTHANSLDEIKRVLVTGGHAIIIPMAWITGRKPWQRLAIWLGRTTGEAPPWDEKVLLPLKNRGFDVTWKMIDLTFSRVLLIQLTKVASHMTD